MIRTTWKLWLPSFWRLILHYACWCSSWIRLDFFIHHTWCRWCSPNGPGTWAEVAVDPRLHREELSGCPILTPLPLCRRSAGTCRTCTGRSNQHNASINRLKVHLSSCLKGLGLHTSSSLSSGVFSELNLQVQVKVDALVSGHVPLKWKQNLARVS